MECIVGGHFGRIAELADTDGSAGNCGLACAMFGRDARGGEPWQMMLFSDGFEKGVRGCVSRGASCYVWESGGNSEDGEKARGQ